MFVQNIEIIIISEKYLTNDSILALVYCNEHLKNHTKVYTGTDTFLKVT